MDDNNLSNGSLYESTSSSEGDDDVNEFFVVHIIYKYKEIFLWKTPQMISMLHGA